VFVEEGVHRISKVNYARGVWDMEALLVLQHALSLNTECLDREKKGVGRPFAQSFAR
jgi:hypothetical protein